MGRDIIESIIGDVVCTSLSYGELKKEGILESGELRWWMSTMKVILGAICSIYIRVFVYVSALVSAWLWEKERWNEQVRFCFFFFFCVWASFWFGCGKQSNPLSPNHNLFDWTTQRGGSVLTSAHEFLSWTCVPSWKEQKVFGVRLPEEYKMYWLAARSPRRLTRIIEAPWRKKKRRVRKVLAPRWWRLQITCTPD